MKMNKSHATENKHLNHNQEDKTFVYDFVKTYNANVQQCILEERFDIYDSSICIDGMNINNDEQSKIVGKTVMMDIMNDKFQHETPNEVSLISIIESMKILNNFQLAFFDHISLWLEESFLNNFSYHFQFFVNKKFDKIFLSLLDLKYCNF